jgi:undecaprenyl-diphosphatase
LRRGWGTAALICVRWLLRFIASHNFKIFAWHRIVLGVIILALMW